MDICSKRVDGNQRLVIVCGAGIAGGSLNILTNNDDGEQDQLQESLRDPGNNNNGAVCADRSRKRDEGKECEEIGTPHRANDLGDAHCQARVDPPRSRFRHEFLPERVGVELTGECGFSQP